MFWQQGSRVARQQVRLCRNVISRSTFSPPPLRAFHASRSLLVVKPVLLADIGEGAHASINMTLADRDVTNENFIGIVECEVIQWFVEPGARVEEFSPLCEVQSDKASVEITSRFTGVVKKLHYDAGEMAKVGKPFVDIDIPEGVNDEDVVPATAEELELRDAASPQQLEPSNVQEVHTLSEISPGPATEATIKHRTLSVPAVRHLAKISSVDIEQVPGTGKNGRVMKEDVLRFIQIRDSSVVEQPFQTASPSGPAISFPPGSIADLGQQQETPIALTRTQDVMFKTMTRSLNIPHFLFGDEIDFTSLVELRSRLNRVLAKGGLTDGQVSKLSYLPFIIKAVSMALYKYPILNARVDIEGINGNGNGNGNGKPSLVLRSQHNIGVAMDTPQGLLVPVVKNVGSLNILSIAAELARLQTLAVAGKLSPQDMTGGTITVSNIGSIGGTYLSPVVVEREVAILGIGRMRTVPAFSTVPGEEDKVVKKQVCNFSWCADHRVVDGATMARAAGVVRAIVEEPDVMIMHLH